MSTAPLDNSDSRVIRLDPGGPWARRSLKQKEGRDMKAIEKLFGVSLAVISLTSLITAVTGLIGIALPVWALRTIGIINLVSLPILIYSTVRSMREKAGAARKLTKKAEGKAVPAHAVEAGGNSPVPAPKKVQPKPHPQQLAAKKAAAANRPKKNKKKKK